MHKLVVFPLLLLFSLAVAQEKSVPAEVNTFIPAGYVLLDYITGDINNDRKPDALLLLKQPGEDSLFEQESIRPFIVLVRQADASLKQVLRNDSVIMCRHCGGVFGDPYAGASTSGNGFSISFYGGSSWRWAYEYQFVFNPSKQTWYLHKETESSFQSGDPKMTMNETVIEETELGQLSIAEFSSAPQYDDSRWRVNAEKTFFYSNPKLGAKPRKAYLVKGNQATGIRELTNFVEVSFENNKGVITTGFILKKDLVKIK